MNHIFIKVYFKVSWDFGITFFLHEDDFFFLRVSVDRVYRFKLERMLVFGINISSIHTGSLLVL